MQIKLGLKNHFQKTAPLLRRFEAQEKSLAKRRRTEREGGGSESSRWSTETAVIPPQGRSAQVTVQICGPDLLAVTRARPGGATRSLAPSRLCQRPRWTVNADKSTAECLRDPSRASPAQMDPEQGRVHGMPNACTHACTHTHRAGDVRVQHASSCNLS